MFSDAKIEDFKEQHYAGIRTQVTMQALSEVIPQLIDEVFGWLEQHNIESAGPPIIRYHVIDMANQLDIEIGVLVADPITGDDRVSAGVIPAGQYGALIYKDVSKGIEGNGALIAWAEKEGIKWDAWDTEKGHAFRSRIEYLLDGPEDDPDPAQWDTKVAILIAK